MTVPRAAFVLALRLALGHADQGTDEELEHSGDGIPKETSADEELATSTLSGVTTEALATKANSTAIPKDYNQLEFILMVVIPLAVLVLLLLTVVLIATYFKRKRTKQEPSSQGSQSALQT